MLTSRSKWHPVALIGPPEPPNLGKTLLEVLHELAVLGEHRVRVTPADGGEQFVHKVFLGTWVCDAQGRRKIFMRGGPSQLRGCPWCRLRSHVEGPDGTVKVAPAGYVKDVIQRVDGVEYQAVRTGASCLLLSGDQMLEEMGVIGQIEEDLAKSALDWDEVGELSPAARRAFNTTRLEHAKQNTCCHGVCQVPAVLGYVSMVNLFPLAPDHLCFLGLGKDFWRNFLDVLGHVGFRAMKQEDRRKALVLIPSNFGRGLRPSFAVSKKSKGKVTVQSGWVIETAGTTRKRFPFLPPVPLFEEARNVVTEEDGPERKAQVDAAHQGGRTRYLADITVYARMAEGNGFGSLLVSNLHSAAGAKRVLPKNVCETMMRDLLFAQQIYRLKAHRLYRKPKPNKKAPAPWRRPSGWLGAHPLRGSIAADFKDHLEKLLDDVRHGETSRDNSFFVYKMLKQVPDADPPPYTTEELESEEELPRNLLAEREDAKYTTMVARAQHFYLATPPPPLGVDSDAAVAARGPFGLHCV
eukprot:jgi/Tetstr1/431658/TSEL_021187.t1